MFQDRPTLKSPSQSVIYKAFIEFRINENQLALEADIMELTDWVEKQSCIEVADNVRGALGTIDRNEEFIKLTLAALNAP